MAAPPVVAISVVHPELACAGWHGQTRLTVLVGRVPRQEDTLKLRLGVPPIDHAPTLL
jgi:hypothetical protein